MLYCKPAPHACSLMGGQKVKNIKLGEYPGITEFPERILIFQQLNYVLPGQKVWKQEGNQLCLNSTVD
jgi:hypothetical protein